MRACDNPFRSERVLQVRYRVQGATWEELLERWRAVGRRGAIIGPHGTGKTTLLETLEPRLHAQGFSTRFIRLNTERRNLEPGVLNELCTGLTLQDVLLVDGAEQMSPLAWHWFRWRTRAAAGLLITTHAPGRLPAVWKCHTSPTLLAEIAAGLLAVEPVSLRDRAEALFRKHQGNLRDALREWYDLVGA